jgi:hypothetical protein
MDLSKIPKVNFSLDQILPAGECCRFTRIDLKLPDETVWPFIRIQEKFEDSHALIYSSFLDEVAGKFEVSRNDIEKLVSAQGDGFLERRIGNSIKIWRTPNYFKSKNERDKTKVMLQEALSCQIV